MGGAEGICNVNSHICAVNMGDRYLSVYGYGFNKGCFQLSRRKKHPQNARSINVRKWAIQTLEKSIHTGKEVKIFDMFDSEIMRDFRYLFKLQEQGTS